MRPHRWQPTRLPRPWDSPGKNAGVGCHFPLQCMKVKSEREVTQLRLPLSNPMDYSLPGSSIHGIFQARVLEWGAMWDSLVVWKCNVWVTSSWCGGGAEGGLVSGLSIWQTVSPPLPLCPQSPPRPGTNTCLFMLSELQSERTGFILFNFFFFFCGFILVVIVLSASLSYFQTVFWKGPTQMLLSAASSFSLILCAIYLCCHI